MGELLEKVKAHREAILLGELGALLHMFGKCSSEFLVANSEENQALPRDQQERDSHQDLRHLPNLKPFLEDSRLGDVFTIPLAGQVEKLTGNFTDFLQKYGRCNTCKGTNPAKCPRCQGKSPDAPLIWLFNACHRMTSADEKGVVRRKQCLGDTWITTPFGHGVRKLDLNAIDAVRATMDRGLSKVLDAYLNSGLGIDRLHDQAVAILKEGMSQALGETRQPANDVTLWAQSHGVASLYKPVLAALAMGLDPCPKKNGSLDYNNVTWRLLGIGWNGRGFVERGRRPGDILRRQELLDEIVAEIQQRLEVTHPIGNQFYRDLNGVFFTFPGIEDGAAAELVGQLAPELVGLVRDRSDNELWPFFTLSKPRRTLTAITKEIKALGQLAAAPRVAALLSMEQAGSGRREQLLVDGPILAAPRDGQEVCPVCQLRAKQREDETCKICQDRRSNRQRDWQENRQGETIWLDEVADANGRLALVTIKFDLSRWLSGEWLTTAFSQTFDDWWSSDRMKAVLEDQEQRKSLESITSLVAPTAEVATAILNAVVTGQVTRDQKFEASLLSTFFKDIRASHKKNAFNYIGTFLENLSGRINDDVGYRLTPSDLATAVFTQNASPARLARIWEETETFLDKWIGELATETCGVRSQRLSFTSATPAPKLRTGQTYRITVPNLRPGPLVVLCVDENRLDFLTVDSLEKFWFQQGDRRAGGAHAVQHALIAGGIESWFDEATGTLLPSTEGPAAVNQDGFETEPYLPFIVLGRSPVFCQLLLPANRAAAALQQLLALAEERFAKVQGKLPLHAGVLVAKRRFPLYALIEAGHQVVDHPSFQEGKLQHPWWDTVVHAQDPFYGQYPTKDPHGEVHRLTDLAPVDRARKCWLAPGYVDFDYLGSSADRHRLTYELDAHGRPNRPAIAYGHLRPRPFPLQQLREVFDIWKLLTTHLTRTQRQQLEEALVKKLEEWDEIGSEAMPVFENFAKALLRRSFGARWMELAGERRDLLERSAQDGLLLETLELFGHVLKEGSSDE